MTDKEARGDIIAHLQAAIATRVYDIRDSEFAKQLGINIETAQNDAIMLAAATAATDAIITSAGDPPNPRASKIDQIEAILNREEDVALTILPNGEIMTAPGQPTGKKPLTFREHLGGEYANTIIEINGRIIQIPIGHNFSHGALAAIAGIPGAPNIVAKRGDAVVTLGHQDLVTIAGGEKFTITPTAAEITINGTKHTIEANRLTTTYEEIVQLAGMTGCPTMTACNKNRLDMANGIIVHPWQKITLQGGEVFHAYHTGNA